MKFIDNFGSRASFVNDRVSKYLVVSAVATFVFGLAGCDQQKNPPLDQTVSSQRETDEHQKPDTPAKKDPAANQTTLKTTKPVEENPVESPLPNNENDQKAPASDPKIKPPIRVRNDPSERIAVAVLEFEDTSPKDEFRRLDRAIQSMLTTDLSVSRDIELVERARIQDVLEELELVKTGYLDPKTAAKVGKGVGARAVMTGSFWVHGEEMRIDARLVHVETGTIIVAEEITGRANEFTGLEKQLARKVLDAVGVRLSAFEAAELSKRHTESLVAANRYGEALQAEDVGDLDIARRNATAALEADPDFGLADDLLTRLNQLLRLAHDDDFHRKVVFLTKFEDELLGWPFEHPRFKPDDFPKLLNEKGPERALFYWLSYLGEQNSFGRAKAYDLLFAHPNRLQRNHGVVTQLYSKLGGTTPVLFWCKVVTSNPEYAPTRPLTEKMLRPNPLSTPISGPYPAYYFWRLLDVYQKRFEAQASIQADFAGAVETLEHLHAICQPLISESAYLQQLKELKQTVNTPSRLREKRREARERQQLWRLARDHLIEYHSVLQERRFGQRANENEIPSADDVLQQLMSAYATDIVVWLGGRPAQERHAKQIVNELLEEADGARFIAQKQPVFVLGDRPTLITVLHIAGCPHSYLSKQNV